MDVAASSLLRADDSVITHAWRYYEDGQYDSALSLFQKALEEGHKRDGYYGLGLVAVKKGDVVRAVKSLINAIKCDTAFHEAYIALGDIYLSVNQAIPAVENYGQAVALVPESLKYKQSLINAVSTVTLKKVNPNLKGVLTDCLETEGLSFVHLGPAWCSIAMSGKRIARIYKLRQHKNYPVFKNAIGSIGLLDDLMDQFFLLGLGRFIVPSPDFERWCTYLRRYLIETISDGAVIFSDPDYLEFMLCALSRYCAYTDYVFQVSEDEERLVSALRQKVEANDQPHLSDLACLGCYVPLATLKNARAIEAGLSGGDHVSQIPKAQIADYYLQQEIKKDIPVFGKIEDKVSLEVREQYEVFSHSRWAVAAQDLFNPDVEGHLKGNKAKILVAGCGTGQEAIQLSYVFPDAEITAVDLSCASLAYAIFKTRQLGIENIKFLHGDILKLGDLDTQFDYITSSGVLHHMDDPKAAWSILNSLLKPDGLMRIALYSRQARWAINDARAVIEKKNVGSDAHDIREFRNKIAEHLKHKSVENLANCYDYYSLHECRDLLFHVQEHQFDLPQIKDILEEFGLEFLQFYLSTHDIQRYVKRNSDDPEARDLDKWAQWESKHPNLFMSMYTFWCRPKTS